MNYQDELGECPLIEHRLTNEPAYASTQGQLIHRTLHLGSIVFTTLLFILSHPLFILTNPI
jgi:hypothetical protein